MTQQISYSNSTYGKTIHPDQLTQILEAILAGKYSWACFLLLRCAGYNPIHYLPYRTYHRLVKEHCEHDQPSNPKTQNINLTYRDSQPKSNGAYAGKPLTKITDLAYLEEVRDSHPQVRGGHSHQGLESHSSLGEWVLSKIQGFLSWHH